MKMNKSLILSSLILSYIPVVVHSNPIQILDPSLQDVTVQAQILPSGNAPIRISRSFLEENRLEGKVTLSVPESSFNSTEKSSTLWSQEPPTAPAPTGHVLADYRDFKGCETFTSLSNPVSLCFNVMPDVSSVGVNSKDTSLEGIQDYATQALQNSPQFQRCSYKVKNLELQKADRNESHAVVDYVGEVVPADGCEGHSQLLQIRLELRKN